MASVKFLTKSNPGKFASMYVRFSSGRGVDITASTPWHIPGGTWNNKGQRFNSNLKYSEIFTSQRKLELEIELTRLRNFIMSEYLNLASLGSTPTKEWLNLTINKAHAGPAEKISLNQFIDNYIEGTKVGSRLSAKGRPLSAASIKAYKSFQTQFNKYQADRNRNLNFDDITVDMYDDYVNYFYSKEYSPNTIGKLVKILKIFIKMSREEGLHKNYETERKRFKTIAEPVEDIYLNEAELRKLYILDLSSNKAHEVARDVFLIGCYTAQRYSDYGKIRYEDIKENRGVKVIELVQKKTGEKVVIPCRPELLAILEKYKDNPPKTWEQKVNTYIKEMGKEAGIKDQIRHETRKGGILKVEHISKYKLIKTHTARRSGCTNMYLAGIPAISIMKISGHKTEREFLKYIKVTQEETAMRLADHPYFAGQKAKPKKRKNDTVK
jgi:integrase